MAHRGWQSQKSWLTAEKSAELRGRGRPSPHKHKQKPPAFADG